MGMVKNGNYLKKKTIMKRINIIVMLLTICSCFNLISCSNEEQEITCPFSDLKFVVEVSRLDKGTRASLNKSSWEKGDQIVVAIDGQEDNVVLLNYLDNGDWAVNQINENTNFLYSSGKLSAVYAEKLEYKSGNIKTRGDVLYTQSGTYEITNNVAKLRLNMKERPISRIAIVGINDSYWLDGMVEYTKLKSLSTMEWDISVNSKGQDNKFIYGDTSVFYGILPSDDFGNTVVKLINTDGASHVRTYVGKQVQKGDYIILKGPRTNEQSRWESDVPVKGIQGKVISEFWIGEKGALSDLYTIIPEDAVNKNVTIDCDKESVFKISNKGDYEALSRGMAYVNIVTEDGGYHTLLNVKVKSVADYVTFAKTGQGTYSIFNGITYSSGFSTTFTIFNYSTIPIQLKTLAGVDISSQGEVEPEEKKSVTLYSSTGYITWQVELVFSAMGKEYTIHN